MAVKSDDRKLRATARRLRALRFCERQQEWLSWPLRWTGTRLEYFQGSRSVFPDAGTLNNAQRCINEIWEGRALSVKFITDVEKWRAERIRLLDRAKYVASLPYVDPSILRQEVKRRNPEIIPVLVNLLAAESLVENHLPESPTLLLCDMAGAAESALLRYVRDAPASGEIMAKALVALCLGRAYATRNDWQSSGQTSTQTRFMAAVGKQPQADWLKRCFRWASTSNNFAYAPEVVATILRRDDGINALNLLHKLQEPVYFKLSDEQVKGMIVKQEVDPALILDLKSALSRMDAVVDCFSAFKREEASEKEKRLQWEKRKRSQEGFSKDFGKSIASLVDVNPDPFVFAAISEICETLLSRFKLNDDLFCEIIKLVDFTSKLSSDLQLGFCRLALEYSENLWKKEEAPDADSVGTPGDAPAADEPRPARVDAGEREEDEREPTPTGGGPELHPEQVLPAIAPAQLRATRIRSYRAGRLVGFLEVIFQLISRTRAPELVRQALEKGIDLNTFSLEVKNAEQFKHLIDWSERCGVIDKGWKTYKFCSLIENLGHDEDGYRYIESFVRAIETAPLERRKHYFESIDDISHSRRLAVQTITTISNFLPRLISSGLDDGTEDCRCVELVPAVLNLTMSNAKLDVDLVPVLIDVCLKHKPLSYSQTQMLDPACAFVHALKMSWLEKSNTKVLSTRLKRALKVALREYLEIFCSMKLNNELDFIEPGIKLLGDYPIVCQMVANHLKMHPRRSFNFLFRLGIAQKFGPEALQSLNRFSRYEPYIRLYRLAKKTSDQVLINTPQGVARHVLRRLCAKGWREIVELAPEAIPYAASYVCSRSIMGKSQMPPDAVQAIFAIKKKMEREMMHLQKLVAENPERTDMARRLASITAQLADGSALEAYKRRLIIKEMRHQCAEAEMEAMELILNDVFRKQLKRIVSEIPPGTQIDSYLINAILLTESHDTNKRLLKRLIRAHVMGDSEWRYRIPANRAFLQSLSERGVDVNVWLGEHQTNCRIDELEGALITMRLEVDPIKVLEMGNYFDTCLGFMGVNSFATIVNACDLNKRVLYVYDKHGTVIARKLIGIDDNWHLVGYRNYISSEDKAIRLRLTQLITGYIKDFAARCRLPLANSGNVPPLSSKHWYDDGTIPWDIPEIAPEP